ncbi:hypothetical protein BCR42DRAFT_449956 [Absidia repens]|uniref:PHD-type domain-containing protein n=1 Tax=Absidia repens TaxID=90262 RepID=A0A1X2IM15_9FUNG|nr:hypothetical protein BCR42DRAFT_449956 [Absidia repens]
MDGLLVKNIPRLLLARILVQLYIIPQQLINSPQFDLLAVLVAGFRDYGNGSDLDGFLSFCAQQAFQCLETIPSTNDTTVLTPATWLWRDHTLCSLNDWDRIDQEQLEQQDSQNRRDTTKDNATNMVGLRLQLASEKIRPQIELVRYGKKVANLHDERFTCVYEGQYISLENILNGALEYMSNRRQSATESSSSTTTTVNHTDAQSISALLKQRMEQLAEERKEYERKSAGRSETDFVLMGALMVKSDTTQSTGAIEDDWYLYLRDYTADVSGSNWRIIKGTIVTNGEIEMRISSHQVLADLRGVNVKNNQGLECVPSPASDNYRPVYLFYCNNDIISRSAHNTLETNSAPSSSENTQHNYNKATRSSNVEQNKEQSITFEDYSFENDGDDGNNMEYVIQDGDDDDDDDIAMEMCKHCGIPESIDDINTIFFCDECNLGVHQLCEQPPIAMFEMNIDPWYCRDCCARKGLPLPTPPHYMTPVSEKTSSSTQQHQPEPLPLPSTTIPIMPKHEAGSLQSPTPVAGNELTPTNGTEPYSINGHETDEHAVKKRKLDD